MYDEELSPAPVKPLNVKRKEDVKRKEETLSVRRKRDEMKEINVGRDVDIDEDGLKSPIWVPRLTPTRKGDDLFISVGWGAQGRP
jgi:stress response protein YsnF